LAKNKMRKTKGKKKLNKGKDRGGGRGNNLKEMISHTYGMPSLKWGGVNELTVAQPTGKNANGLGK